MTNFHVIEGAQELDVAFADGSHRAATIIGMDPANDLAIIRVEPGGASYRVIILDDSAESYVVKAVHGPYEAR